MDPALADKGHVANHSRCGEARQVAHDVVLQLLGFMDGQAPVLGIGNHVAHVEVVGHDFGAIEQSEAEIEQVFCVGVHAAQEHTLIAHVAEADFQDFLRCFGHQRRDLAGVVHMRMQRQIHIALARFLG